MKRFLLIIATLALTAGYITSQPGESDNLVVLGITQDGGYPHIGCQNECCELAWANPDMRRYPVSFALVDPDSRRWFLLEATPEIRDQLQLFKEITHGEYNYLPDAVFVSHAHIGHYTGLMEFGREAMNTHGLAVYCLPRMKKFLEQNGPWSQLVGLGNIEIIRVPVGGTVSPGEQISITMITVPHRDEYSETGAYVIEARGNKYLIIPDIDKWDRWDRDITEMVKSVDYAFLDGTFFDIDELPGRDMAEIPHPFIKETMNLFNDLPLAEKEKIHFIHMNHSNPLLWSDASVQIRRNGFNVAVQGMAY